MNHEVTPDQQDQRESDLRQVLDDRGELGAQVGVADVGPLELVSRLLQLVELTRLGDEGLDHADAVDVLVDDRRDLSQARLDQPRHREHAASHAHAHHEHERQRRHRDERERHVDRQHVDERDQRDRALDDDVGAERQVHLHRADVRVGAGDQLAGLDTVVEVETHARQMRVDDVAQIGLHPVCGPHQQQASAI